MAPGTYWMEMGALPRDRSKKEALTMAAAIRIVVWNEFRHEQAYDRLQEEFPEGVPEDRRQEEANTKIIKELYPKGMHEAIAAYLNRQPDMDATTATLDSPEHGLTDAVLDACDVLFWWGHTAHEEVQDSIVDKVKQRVLEGMGLVCLHSAHFSKIFRSLMGTTCDLKWREIGEKERLWIVEPGHPIAQGLGEYIEIPHVEMYGERFDIPAPDTLVFVSWFEGGEVFRSGCCYHRGQGKMFYFRPGHETFPIYHQPEILQVLANAARWAAPAGSAPPQFGNREPLEHVNIDE